MSEAFKMAIAGAVGGGLSGIMTGPVGMVTGATVGFVGGLASYYYFKDKQANLSALEEKITSWKFSDSASQDQGDGGEKRVAEGELDGEILKRHVLTESQVAREDALRRLGEGLVPIIPPISGQRAWKTTRQGNTSALPRYGGGASAERGGGWRPPGGLPRPGSDHTGLYPQLPNLPNDQQQVGRNSRKDRHPSTAVPAV